MIRLQDIADMAGVSRTTVSNVINGNTKRVSQSTIDRITAILKEQNYVPHMGSVMLSGHGSRIIGVVLGFSFIHGMQSLRILLWERSPERCRSKQKTEAIILCSLAVNGSIMW